MSTTMSASVLHTFFGLSYVYLACLKDPSDKKAPHGKVEATFSGSHLLLEETGAQAGCLVPDLPILVVLSCLQKMDGESGGASHRKRQKQDYASGKQR